MAESDHPEVDLDFRMNGPVDLPSAITNEASTLALFCEYLSHSATRHAIISAAGKNHGSIRIALDELDSLHVSGSLVREIVTCAPSLVTIVRCARDIDDPVILPESAIPSSQCVDACVAAYHAWIAACSRSR